MPRTRLAACLSGAVIIAPAGCGTGSGGDNGGGNASGPIQIWEGYAKKLTKASAKQFGTAYVTPGSEDTVWHWEALLWEAGGQLLNADNTKAAFDSAAGLASPPRRRPPPRPAAGSGCRSARGTWC
jgi:hypothetical protein